MVIFPTLIMGSDLLANNKVKVEEFDLDIGYSQIWFNVLFQQLGKQRKFTLFCQKTKIDQKDQTT